MNLSQQQEAHRARRQRWMTAAENKRLHDEQIREERIAWAERQYRLAEEEKHAAKWAPRRRSALLWAKQFNHHVIAYRQWQLSQETDWEYVRYERPSVEEIILTVLARFPGVTVEDVKGPRRLRHIVRPRQICIYEVVSQRPDLSYPQIGRMFGGRDHTTCLHAFRKIAAELGCSGKRP